ncbi:hypothetical protein DENSPDRAFT_830645 [Dentipellis sp. KUC8613]|nr:hypothetical protein DENSPDRAFT_830645 [Dentipellis sp. KUC8613]
MTSNPFCEPCGKWFSQEKELRRHNRSFHSANPPTWMCTWEGCSYTSRQKPVLEDHINDKHTKIKPHQCPDCPATFSTQPQRSVHRKKCHGHSIKHSAEYDNKIKLLALLGKGPAARKAKRARRRCEPYPSRSPVPPQASGSHDASSPAPEASTIGSVDPPDLTGGNHWCKVTPSFANESAVGRCFQIDFTDIARPATPVRESSIVPGVSSSSSSSGATHFSFAPTMPQSATTASTGTLYSAPSPVWQPASSASLAQQPVQHTDVWANNTYAASAEQYAAPYNPPGPLPVELQPDAVYGASTSTNYLQHGFVDGYPGSSDVTGLETQQLTGYSLVAANEMLSGFGFGMVPPVQQQNQVYQAAVQDAPFDVDGFNFPLATLGSPYNAPPWQSPPLQDLGDEHLGFGFGFGFGFEQSGSQMPAPVVPAQPEVAVEDENWNAWLSFINRYLPQS